MSEPHVERRKSQPGRMLVKRISEDRRIPRLIARLDEQLGAPHGAYGALVYTWIKAHLDIEGRMVGHPRVVTGNVIPLLESVDSQHVREYLAAAAELGLLLWYEVEGEQFIADPAFNEEQIGLRKTKGAAKLGSSYPPPEKGRSLVAVAPGQGDLFQPAGASVAPRRRQPGATKPPIGRQRGASVAPAEAESAPEVAPAGRQPGASVASEEKGSEEKGRSISPACAHEPEASPPEPPPPALEVVPSPRWNVERFTELWCEITRRPAGDSSDLVTASRFCREAAELRSPPVEPEVLARDLIRANVEMLEEWARKGEHHGAVSVEDFASAKHFAKVCNWLDGKRAAARQREGSAQDVTRGRYHVDPHKQRKAGVQ